MKVVNCLEDDRLVMWIEKACGIMGIDLPEPCQCRGDKFIGWWKEGVLDGTFIYLQIKREGIAVDTGALLDLCNPRTTKVVDSADILSTLVSIMVRNNLRKK